jgi:hypothetical protein
MPPHHVHRREASVIAHVELRAEVDEDHTRGRQACRSGKAAAWSVLWVSLLARAVGAGLVWRPRARRNAAVRRAVAGRGGGGARGGSFPASGACQSPRRSVAACGRSGRGCSGWLPSAAP